MENMFGEILFYKEGIPFRSVENYNHHGIEFSGATEVVYHLGFSTGPSRIRRTWNYFDFENAETRNKWSMMVVNIKKIPDDITQHGNDLFLQGDRTWLDYKKKWFHAWLRILKQFIEEFGAEKLPVDIQGAMKETEETLGLPVTFEGADYHGN